MSTSLTEIILGAARLSADEKVFPYSTIASYEEFRNNADLQSDLSIELSIEIHSALGLAYDDDNNLTVQITEVAFEAIANSLTDK